MLKSKLRLLIILLPLQVLSFVPRTGSCPGDLSSRLLSYGCARTFATIMSTTTCEEKPVKELTLVFCRRVGEGGMKEILLGMKKRGFGMGKWNGFGGKVEAGETIADAAKRELLEESHVTASHLSLRGKLIFNLPSYPSTMKVYVYDATKYYGEPEESDEMQPRWFPEGEIPHKDMWPDDEYWMPRFLTGKLFYGEFDYSDDKTIERYTITELPSLEYLLAT